MTDSRTDDAAPLPPDLSDLPQARVASFTPRELAAVLNEPRRTPAYGVPAVRPGSPIAVAAGMAQPQAAAEPVAELTDVLLFRLGGERFAAELAAIDEAVDLAGIHPVPESPSSLLGVFPLRGRLLPLYSAAASLHVAEGEGPPTCAFVLSHEGERIGIAVDELDDALSLPAAALRDAPGAGTEEGDGVLLGIVHVPDGVVTVVSVTALARACIGSGPDGPEPDNPSAAPESA